MQPERRARLALWLAVIALLLWPLSYAWVPLAGRNPDWILVLVPVAEIGSLLLAISAIWIGARARRIGARCETPPGRWVSGRSSSR